LGEGRRPLLAIGEAKWGKRLDRPDLERLERIRSLLVRRPGFDSTGTRLVLASGQGFADDLRRAAASRSIGSQGS
jgi:hypothetical protein